MLANIDLKLTVDWIRANKLLLNASRTEIVLLKPRNKKIISSLIFVSVVKKLSNQVTFNIYMGHSAR